MSIEVEEAQDAYIRAGGLYAPVMRRMRTLGQIPKAGEYDYQEYPKILRFPTGETRIEKRTTKTLDKETLSWDETIEVVREVTVHSEEEEERLLSGGMTNAQIEDERQVLIRRGRSMGIAVDPRWTTIRLRRELGEALDAPPPGDEMATLQRELARLQEIAALKAQIAAMQAAAEDAPDADEVPQKRPYNRRPRGLTDGVTDGE